MIGGAKSRDLRSFVGRKGVSQELTDKDVDPQFTVTFTGCLDCNYTLSAICTKVFVQGCRNCTFNINGKVLTSTLELYKCDNVTIHANTPIKTVQADICKSLNANFKEKSCFHHLIWAGCYDLKLNILSPEFEMITGYDMVQKQFENLDVAERAQFKIYFYGSGNKLFNDRVIRLDNGYPTTKREADDYDRRQEYNMQQMAKEMGININRKASGPKVGRNEKCPCGSGKKFKACCDT